VLLATKGQGDSKRIVGVVTVDMKKLGATDHALNVFCCENLVLAAGGPGELYETTVYPKGQLGIHGLALRAGLAAENLTESQFGLASIKFRWNVSGSYCQVIPRIFSTDANGNNKRDFLADFFPTMSKMTTNIFLKGYQWPFDPQRIENHQSSLIDVLVFNEMQKGRRVFMDFTRNPIGTGSIKRFEMNDLGPEALDYLTKTGSLQQTPIERLVHLNPLAIDIYKEHSIDLYCEPLEIAVCAQHNNGGFAVDRWWQSNIAHTFVIGEMAGTHGVKRPGGSALNAGQVGGLRAAEYIANACSLDAPDCPDAQTEIDQQLSEVVARLDACKNTSGLVPDEVIARIRNRMTASAAHIREPGTARKALTEAVADYRTIQTQGFKTKNAKGIIGAIQVEHLALTSVAFLKAIVELLQQDGGSRGSHLVLADDGVQMHPDIVNSDTGRPLKFKPENEALRSSILRIKYDPKQADLFACENVLARKAPADAKAFESAWRDFREGKIYND
jgi:succinate dehydrogenase/fumarate reductase flavoprotein subunit